MLDAFYGLGAAALFFLAALVAKHGWGWVLAKLKARKASLQAYAQAEKDKLLTPLASRVDTLEVTVADIKKKTGLSQ